MSSVRVRKAAAGAVLDVPNPLQVLIGQNRLRGLQAPVVAGLVDPQEVRPRPDHADQRHHQLFADRVDRRIGDLREVLLEIGREMLGTARKHRRRIIRTHRADGLLTREDHRAQQELDVFLGVAEGLLRIQQGGIVGGHGSDTGRQLVEPDLRLLQPFTVGLGLGELGLDLGIVDDAALLQIDQEHLAGLQTPFLDDALLGNIQARPSRRP